MAHYADTSNYTDEELDLWNRLIELQHEKQLQSEKFKTARGLEFTYHITGNELFIDRKEKSITRSTVNMAYKRAIELMRMEGKVSGLKKLGVFGSSYLLPIFVELGICSRE